MLLKQCKVSFPIVICIKIALWLQDKLLYDHLSFFELVGELTVLLFQHWYQHPTP